MSIESEKISKPNFTETIEDNQVVENTEILDTVREFSLFAGEDEKKTKVEVKEIGDFAEMLEGHSEFPHALEIAELFKNARVNTTLPDGREIAKGPHLLVAGGFVRDLLLDKEPHDIDFATNATSSEVKQIISEYFKEDLESGELSIKSTATTDKDLFVLRVRFRSQNEEYEFATFRQEKDYQDGRRPESVEAVRYPGLDAGRRDLTVNALFYNTYSGKVIDYVGGLRDIAEKKLRFVGDPDKRVEEDKIRMLRYVRFLMKTGFAEDSESWQVIKDRASEISKLSAEAIRKELTKIVESGDYGRGLEKLKESGLLREILPEVNDLSNCEQGPPYHLEGNALKHTEMVCSNLPEGSSVELVMAAYLHDIGKTSTREEKDLGGGETKVSFLGHDKLSANLAIDRLKALRFNNQQIKDIVWLVEKHMAVYRVPEMKEVKARELVGHELFNQLLILAEADITASIGSPEIQEKNKQLLADIKARVEEIKKFSIENTEQIEEIQKAINGRQIIEIIKGVSGSYNSRTQGRLVGLIKTKALEQIAEEKIATPQKAEEVLTRIAEAEIDNWAL